MEIRVDGPAGGEVNIVAFEDQEMAFTTGWFGAGNANRVCDISDVDIDADHPTNTELTAGMITSSNPF